MVASPNEEHQIAVGRLGTRMYSFVEERELGIIFFPPFDVLLTDSDVVQPDLIFVSNERAHIRTRANIQGAPDLVVEILSPSTARRDWTRKRALYARHGVKEYWIVDTASREIWLMLLKDGLLEIEGTYRNGDTVTSTIIEGFSVNVSDIF